MLTEVNPKDKFSKFHNFEPPIPIKTPNLNLTIKNQIQHSRTGEIYIIPLWHTKLKKTLKITFKQLSYQTIQTYWILKFSLKLQNQISKLKH